MVSVFLKCDCGYERTMDHGPKNDDQLALPIYSYEYKVCPDCREVKSVKRLVSENVRMVIEEREVLNIDTAADSESSEFFSDEVKDMSLSELKELLADNSNKACCPDCQCDHLDDVVYGDNYVIDCPRCSKQMSVSDLIASD